MRVYLSVHTVVHYIWNAFACSVYAGSSMEFQCFEIQIKTEADSNDINECPCDDTPSTGMFALSLCTAFTLTFLSSCSAHQHKWEVLPMKYLSACPSVCQSTFKTLPLALLDLSTAFDTVDHCILFLLCHHCASYGVVGVVLTWFNSTCQ